MTAASVRPVEVGELATLLDRATALATRPATVPHGIVSPVGTDHAPGSNGSRGAAVLGIVGAPGSGKTTLALAVVAGVGARLGKAAVQYVPMDGFHLADVELERLGRRDRKGDADTFDPAGYATLLRRIRAGGADTVYAPAFERDIEQPLAGAIAVLPGTRLVVTEGLYLLGGGPWSDVGALMDETWFVDLAPARRTARLLERHQLFGKASAAAAEWVQRVDLPNADRVEATRGRADVAVAGDLELTPLARDA